jgi:zinc-ribbon domain
MERFYKTLERNTAMSQNPSRFCIQCGTSLPLEQRFCSNCGADQTKSAPQIQGTPSAGSYSSPQQAQQGYQQVPTYAQVPPNTGRSNVGVFGALLGLLFLRRAERRASRRIAGCFVWMVILVALLICGFSTRSMILSKVSSVVSQTSSVSGNGKPNVTVTPSTSLINATFVYSGITITVVNAQQNTNYADDTNTDSPGLLRLNLKEQTGAIKGVSANYLEDFQLIAPDGTTINPYQVEQGSAPDQSVSRTNWLDFPIAKNIQVDQYSLRVGTAAEAQITFPLTGKADLSQYAPQKATLNKPFTYGGVNFTLVDATRALSFNGPQANKGMVYVSVDLTINNNTQNTFYGSLTEVRLKAGVTLSPPVDTLNSTAAGQTNVQATLIFSVPQGSQDFSLIFMPSTDNNAPNQVTTDFRIS